MLDQQKVIYKNPYLIPLISGWQSATVMLVFLLGCLPLIMLAKDRGIIHNWPEFLWLGLVVLLVLSAYYLSRKIGTAQVHLILDENGIEQVWQKQFGFSHNSNCFVHWSEIVDYRFENSHRYVLFKVTLRSGREWVLNVDEFKIKQSDYFAFRDVFIVRVNQINELVDDNFYKIQLSKTFQESRTALIFSVFIVLWLISSPVFLIYLYFIKSPWMDLLAILIATSFVPLFMFVYWVHIGRE